MKNFKRKSSALAFILLMAITLSAQPYGSGKCPNTGEKRAQNGKAQQGKQYHHGKMMAILELTEDQQAQWETLQLSHQKKMLPLRNELAEKKSRMNTLSTMETVDMKAINTLIDEMSVVKTKMAKDKAAHHQDIRKMLTEEQRIKFDLHASNRGKGYRM